MSNPSAVACGKANELPQVVATELLACKFIGGIAFRRPALPALVSIDTWEALCWISAMLLELRQ